MKKEIKTYIICGVFIIITILFSIFYNTNKNKTDNEKFSRGWEYLHDYKVNEIVPIYVSKEDMAKKYLANYVYLIINDPKKAYELVDDSYKKEKFANYEEFLAYINKIKSVTFYNAIVKEYSLTSKNNHNYYYIKDNADNNFVFKEISIMNYTVFLDNYTVK